MNKTLPHQLHDELLSLLNKLRLRRNFNAECYIEIKTDLLLDYFNKSDIEACVVGISGGIDSAVTLALLKRLTLMKNSKMKTVILKSKQPNSVLKGWWMITPESRTMLTD